MEHIYLWLKALHIIGVIAWMCGLLYLPRLFVYHTQVLIGSDQDRLFQTMEKKLLRYIMNPAMIVTFILGPMLMMVVAADGMPLWLHIKLSLVIIMAAFHMLLARHRKNFEKGINKKSARYFRIINEVPTILMIIIVILAVLKPF